MLGDDDAKVHAEDAARAGRRRVAGGLALGRVLLGHDELEEQRVRDFGAVGRLGVAGVFQLAGAVARLADAVVDFHVDEAVVARIVRLPAVVELLLANDARLVAGGALDVADGAGRGGVLGAGGRGGLERLLELPGDFLELPQVDRLDLFVVRHEPVELERQLVGARRVDDRQVVGAGLDVGRGEDADRVVGEERLRYGALHRQGAVEAERGGRGGGGVAGNLGDGLELVGDGDERGVGGGGQVTAKQHGEGKRVLAAAQTGGVVEEDPGLELGDFVLALVAVALAGALVGGVNGEGGLEAVYIHGVLLDVQEELAGEDGAGAVLAGAVEDDGGALDAPVDGGGGAGGRVEELFAGDGRAGGAAKGQGQLMVALDGVDEVVRLDGVVVGVGVVGATGDGVVPRGLARGVARGGAGAGGVFYLGNVARGEGEEAGDAVRHVGGDARSADGECKWWVVRESACGCSSLISVARDCATRKNEETKV